MPFPPIGELPYFVTLAPHGFYWFELVDPPGDDTLSLSLTGPGAPR